MQENTAEKCKYFVSIRTLKLWQHRFDEEIWDYQDKSTRPNKIYYKVTLEAEKAILNLRYRTGGEAKKLHKFLLIRIFQSNH